MFCSYEGCKPKRIMTTVTMGHEYKMGIVWEEVRGRGEGKG
jgi:hypothetical protein